MIAIEGSCVNEKRIAPSKHNAKFLDVWRVGDETALEVIL
jgi:hypothetical protein